MAPHETPTTKVTRVVFKTADGRRGWVWYASPLAADWRCHLESQFRCRVSIISIGTFDWSPAEVSCG